MDFCTAQTLSEHRSIKQEHTNELPTAAVNALFIHLAIVFNASFCIYWPDNWRPQPHYPIYFRDI